MNRIKEAGTLAPTEVGGGKRLLTLITPGQGSSGTYSAEMLAQAAADKVFPKGTQGHIDHDTIAETMDKPEGSLRNLALYLAEDARWEPSWVDPDTGTKGRLAAEAFIGSQWRPFVNDFEEILGVSISAAADITRQGVVERLIPDPFNRADLVTVAGRGGRIGEALEAARVIEARSAAMETTHGDKNSWLARAVRAMHGERGRYVWFEDFDDDYVYFSGENFENDTTSTYRQAYSLTGSEVTLAGEPEPVHRRTEYDPITTDSPADPAGATEKKENATMAHIDDKELATLRENASRADTLATELATERAERKKEREDAEKVAAESRRTGALAAVTTAFGEDAPSFYTTAAESAAKAEDFDLEAFTTMVTEAAARDASAAGAGDPGTGAGTVSESAGGNAKERTPEDIINALG